MRTPARSRDNKARLAELPPTPWLRVRRVQLIRREIREYLPVSTIELLLQMASAVDEGETQRGDGGRATRAFASSMLTIDLQRAALAIREQPDTSTALRLVELLTDDEDLRRKLTARMRLALAERLGVAPDALRVVVDVTVRAKGRSILIDVDGSASHPGE